MMRGSMAQAPMSQPASPTRVNRNAQRASGVASRRSEAIARIAPAPTADPVHRGNRPACPQVIIALTRSPVIRVKASNSFISIPTSGPMMSCTSPPEQKFPPFDASTTTSTSDASARARKVSRSSA